MLEFLEHTWYLWWILAVVVILRWFHYAIAAADVCSESVVEGHVSQHCPFRQVIDDGPFERANGSVANVQNLAKSA